MKRLLRILSLAAVTLTFLPVISSAQTLDSEGSFTLNAFVIGFLIVGVIFLVFLGLMLLARVNELLSWEKKAVSKQKPVDRIEQILNLDELEIDAILQKRNAVNTISSYQDPEDKLAVQH